MCSITSTAHPLPMNTPKTQSSAKNWAAIFRASGLGAGYMLANRVDSLRDRKKTGLKAWREKAPAINPVFLLST